MTNQPSTQPVIVIDTREQRPYRFGAYQVKTPRHEGLLGPLAWILATSPDDSVRDGKQAVAVAQRLNAINDFANPYHLDIMAAAAAEAGDFDVAVHYATKAIESLLHPAGPGTEEQWRRDRLQGIQDRLGLYEAAQPFRTPR